MESLTLEYGLRTCQRNILALHTPLVLFSRKQVSVALYRIVDRDDGLIGRHGPPSMAC